MDEKQITSEATSADLAAPAASAPFQIDIYQIAGDEMFQGHRPDGTGWDWCWAPWSRDWMDDTASKFAYRCLPITIANQIGWWIRNPVGFTAVWNGRREPHCVGFMFDSGQPVWSQWINNQFGYGVITWNTPFLFRTRPEGSRLLVLGPVNTFKHGIQALNAVIESDWMSMSFTMNWKFTAPNVPVRFDQGDPIFQVVPMATNFCTSLEDAQVTYSRLGDNKELHDAYQKWNEGRLKFHQQKNAGELKGDAWQRDYFQGRDVFGREVASGHTTKLIPPKIEYKSPKP